MRLWPLPVLLLAAAPARAAPPAIVISVSPDKVAVTLYRDPERGTQPIAREAPTALALIAETRTVTLPPGRVTVRFEGVASGIVPQTAILFGPPARERNRDAALLSQGGLVDAFTGQRVTLRRTDPATGRTVEEPATVRSAANRLVVTTPRGIEALYCSGLFQTLIYPRAPATLSAKPVLSMTTRDQPGGRVTITLAYVATGFDWDATYVGTLAPDGRSLSLLGWLTLASGDDTSFPQATAAAVAGRIARSEETRDDSGEQARQEARWLDRRSACWPAGTTSDVGSAVPPPPPPPPPPAPMEMGFEDIIVTAQRRQELALSAPLAVAVVARAENLGDLKLYRIPVPVTVAAHAQKQVAFLVKDKVAGALLYRARMEGDRPGDLQMLFRFRNRRQDGAGDPLPAGRAILYQVDRRGRTFVGEATTPDKTVDEEVELVFGEPSDVTLDHVTERDGAKGALRHSLVVRNANPAPIRFELDLPLDSDRVFAGGGVELIRKPGKRVAAMTVAGNGSVRLALRSVERE